MHFHLSDTNPNDQIGGCGCICSELKCLDCKPPYAIFPQTEMANNLSPHTVVSVACAARIVAAAEGEVGRSGEADVHAIPDAI